MALTVLEYLFLALSDEALACSQEHEPNFTVLFYVHPENFLLDVVAHNCERLDSLLQVSIEIRHQIMDHGFGLDKPDRRVTGHPDVHEIVSGVESGDHFRALHVERFHSLDPRGFHERGAVLNQVACSFFVNQKFAGVQKLDVDEGGDLVLLLEKSVAAVLFVEAQDLDLVLSGVDQPLVLGDLNSLHLR